MWFRWIHHIPPIVSLDTADTTQGDLETSGSLVIPQNDEMGASLSAVLKVSEESKAQAAPGLHCG